MTWGAAYLLVFLGGFTLAVVTGFARRLLHPSQLCDFVVIPSHEHLQGLRFPMADFLASFVTLFGLACFLVHGFTSLGVAQEIAIGAGAGLFGIFALRFWLIRVCDPSELLAQDLRKVRVVREIPPNGYGQVEVVVDGAHLKLAARTEGAHAITEGTLVEILDRSESVVIVKVSGNS